MILIATLFMSKVIQKKWELKNEHELLKDQCEMYGAGVRPVKTSGTCCINHQLDAIEKLVDKYG